METSNGDAWQAGRLLVVGDSRYVVEVNPPTVQKVRCCGDSAVMLQG